MSSYGDKRILLVEDEVLIAILLEDMVADLGAVTVGPAYNLQSGLALAETADIDAAILDVNLGDGDSCAIADILAARQIPFFLATGYGHTARNSHNAPILQKPYLSNDIERELDQLFSAEIRTA